VFFVFVLPSGVIKNDNRGNPIINSSVEVGLVLLAPVM